MISFSEAIRLRIASAVASDRVRAKTAGIGAVRVSLSSDREVIVLEFTPAGVTETSDDAQVTVDGPREAWDALLNGSHPLVRETNIFHGRLTSGGDPVSSSWAMSALAEVLAPEEAR